MLRSYVWCVALTRAHPFARLKSIPLEKVAGERLVLLSRKNYSEYHCPRYKGRRDTCGRKILRNLAADFAWSGQAKTKMSTVYPRVLLVIRPLGM